MCRVVAGGLIIFFLPIKLMLFMVIVPSEKANLTENCVIGIGQKNLYRQYMIGNQTSNLRYSRDFSFFQLLISKEIFRAPQVLLLPSLLGSFLTFGGLALRP